MKMFYKNTSADRLAVFESINLAYLPLLIYYMMRGRKIMYLKTTRRIEGIRSFQKAVRRCQMSKISLSDFFDIDAASHDLATDDVEKEYAKMRGKDRMAICMIKMLKSEDVGLVYKKRLSERLHKRYYLHNILKHIAPGYSGKAYFIPSSCEYIKRLSEIDKLFVTAQGRYVIPGAARVLNAMIIFFDKMKYICLLFAMPIWLILNIKKVNFYPDKIKKYQMGVKVFNGDWGFSVKYRSIDFLLDGTGICADNVLFCAETAISKDYIKQFEMRNYHIVEMSKILNNVSYKFIKENIFKEWLPCWSASLLAAFINNALSISTTIRILLRYLYWKAFVEKYSFSNYIVMNDIEFTHIIRNIIFSQEGIKNCLYDHSSSFYDVFVKPYRSNAKHIFYSNLLYNKIFCWGHKSKEMYMSNYNKVGQYIPIGCLWSQHIGSISQHDRIVFLTELSYGKEKIAHKKIVSIFDTSFGDGSPLSYNDIVLFVDGVTKLLESMKDIVIIFKEKWIRKELIERDARIEPIYESLRKNPRCYMAGDQNMDCAPIIAVSDLVVSAPFTSPTNEALGARKKAIFFDPANRFKGSFYGHIPDLVAHGYEELDRLVKYWLYEVSDKMFDIYLDAYIKGGIDAYLDGNAITRLRQALS